MKDFWKDDWSGEDNESYFEHVYNINQNSFLLQEKKRGFI
jgi:hypothetical protein